MIWTEIFVTEIFVTKIFPTKNVITHICHMPYDMDKNIRHGNICHTNISHQKCNYSHMPYAIWYGRKYLSRIYLSQKYLSRKYLSWKYLSRKYSHQKCDYSHAWREIVVTDWGESTEQPLRSIVMLELDGLANSTLKCIIHPTHSDSIPWR